MRVAEPFLRLAAILLLISTRGTWALCKLENGTVARCHDLEDAKYIDTYDLEILKTSVNERHLSGEIFYKLGSIRHLELSHGELQTIDPAAFNKLSDLQSLDLSYNRINSLPPMLFDRLKRLQHLSLRRNTLKTIPEAVLSAKRLKTLDLIGNPFICDCATLKARDTLIRRKIQFSKKTLCAGPDHLKGKNLMEPLAQLICIFEEQDKEMQMLDEPASSDETTEVSPKIDEQTTVSMTPKSEETSPSLAEEKASTPPEVKETSKSSDETSVSEEKTATTSGGSTRSIKETDEDEKLESNEKIDQLAVEGSGTEDEAIEGSGIEGSGTGVPPISWDIPDDDTIEETSLEPAVKTTTEAGLFDTILDIIWNTSTAPEDEKKQEVGLEGEEFIKVTSEKPPAHEEVIVPVIVKSDESAKKVETPKESPVEVQTIGDDSKSSKVKADDETNAEASDASATRQPKKGMGSYVVLAALLAVLAILIGFAAYRGDFCRKRRKRNDPERGTELKDMTKSLLDPGNGPQAKISSNGNLENVPLVSPPDDPKVHDARNDTLESPDAERTRYAGIAPEVIDPVKPPRKSYAPNEEADRAMANNGRSSQDPPEDPVCLRKDDPDRPMNGKNHHDSVSSLGTESRDSPSIRTSPRISSPTNGSLGTLQGLARPPLSPGAQRVKITLQENPDSVPKTPILITRTKTGENLVKTP